MAQHEDPRMMPEGALDAWADLLPDPEAMAHVTGLMMAGLNAAQPEAAAAAAASAAAPGEPQFRLVTYLWGAVAFGTYLVWDLLTGWFQLHPIGLAFLIGFAGICLLAPLLLLPMLSVIEAPANDQGGTLVC